MVPDADSKITCPVCSEAFPNSRFAKDTLKHHYWQKHTGFPKFSKRESQRLLFIMSPAVVALVILLLLVNPSSPEFYYSIFGYVAFSSLVVGRSGFKIRAYKRRWVEEHGAPIDL